MKYREYRLLDKGDFNVHDDGNYFVINSQVMIKIENNRVQELYICPQLESITKEQFKDFYFLENIHHRKDGSNIPSVREVVWTFKDIITNKKLDQNMKEILIVRKSPEVKGPGIVYAPFTMKEHTEESLAEVKKIHEEYHKLHAACPKCGELGHRTTLVGYPVIDGVYVDKNSCKCVKCGDIHTADDRVPAK